MAFKTFHPGLLLDKCFLFSQDEWVTMSRGGLREGPGTCSLSILRAHVVGLLRNLMVMQKWRELAGTNSVKLNWPYFFKNFKIKFNFFIQQLLIRHQFYTHQCIYVNPNRPIHHTTTPTTPPLSPLGVHTLVHYICVSISALQTSSSEPFF